MTRPVHILKTRCGKCDLLVSLDEIASVYCCPQNARLVMEVPDFASKCSRHRVKLGDFVKVQV